MNAPLKITNGGFPLPTFLLVHVTPNADEAKISRIEVWVDQRGDKAPHMVYDDLQMADLAQDVQDSVFLELRAAEIERDAKAQQLRRFDAALRAISRQTLSDAYTPALLRLQAG